MTPEKLVTRPAKKNMRQSENKKKEEERQRAQEYQSTLHIGDPDNKIVDVMGTPEAKNTTQVDGHQSVQWYIETLIFIPMTVLSAHPKV